MLNFSTHLNTFQNTSQNISTHISTHFNTYLNTLQHTSQHNSTHISTHCNTPLNTLQHTSQHISTHISTHFNTHLKTFQHTSQHISTHISTHFNTHFNTHLNQIHSPLKMNEERLFRNVRKMRLSRMVWSRDISVGIATRYGLEGPGIESQWGEIFRTSSNRLRGLPSLLYMGTGSFPGVKCCRGATLTPHPLQVQRSKIE